jgi:hypothetical protein
MAHLCVGQDGERTLEYLGNLKRIRLQWREVVLRYSCPNPAREIRV